MNGLSLSRDFYTQIGAPAIMERFPDKVSRIAAGLVGEGSDCFGYDDEISRDHSWGPGFCLWLTEDDYVGFGAELDELYSSLPHEFGGYKIKSPERFEVKRAGVFSIGSFYRALIGLNRAPETYNEWRFIPEPALAVSINGEIFTDPVGAFSAIRNSLLAYFPEDVRLKKLAARCAGAAQSGQYNYLRCAKRAEYLAAGYALYQFCEDATAIVFLLNRRFIPFYKWSHRMLRELPVLGAEVAEALSSLALSNPSDISYRSESIEKICALLIRELKNQDLSSSESDFLLDHSASVQTRIKDPELSSVPAVSF